MSGNSGELWQKYIETTIDLPALGFRLDVSRMKVDKKFMEQLEEPLQDALVAMAALEAGAIANPDEGRRVGHYWLRAPELAPDRAEGVMIRETRAAIERFVDAVHSARLRAERGDRFSDVVLVGIGGSALGPQLVSDALGSHRDRMQLHFVDNTDPDGIDRLLLKLGNRLSTTLTLVVSKSGGTAETRNGMLELESAYERMGLSFARHAVAVTSEGSLLDQQAKKEGWLGIFPMWDWVGGRTSIMSAVGLLPARLQGIDVDAMLLGAAEMDQVTRGRQVSQNPAAMLAAMWWHAGQGRGQKDMVILPYKDRLLLFSRYLQQLVMESLGKEKNLMGKVVEQGIAVYGNKGSTDQHAYVQQLREGVHNFFVTFIEVLKDRDGDSMEVASQVTSGDYLLGFFLGTRAALTENGRESMTLTLRDVSPFSLGALIALYERAVGLYASLVGVNAYHQPGVEAGKRAANKVLELQRALAQVIRNGASGRAAELAVAVPGPPDWETTLKVLEHMAANGRIRRTAGAAPWDAVFSRL